MVFISILALSLVGCNSETDKKAEEQKIVKEGKFDTSAARYPSPNEKK